AGENRPAKTRGFCRRTFLFRGCHRHTSGHSFTILYQRVFPSPCSSSIPVSQALFTETVPSQSILPRRKPLRVFVPSWFNRIQAAKSCRSYSCLYVAHVRSSSSCLPCPTIFPRSITTIVSALRIVEKRCAMTNIVVRSVLPSLLCIIESIAS